MGSPFMLKMRISLKPFTPFPHQGSSAVTLLSVCKPSQLPLSVRFLCSRDPNPKGQQAHSKNNGQGVVKKSTTTSRTEGSWNDGGTGRGKTSTVRQSPIFPKSVFAAGMAKRTAEMLMKKSAVVSQDQNVHVAEPEGMTTRRAAKMQPPDRPLSAAEWKAMKESLGNSERFGTGMMSALYSSGADLDIAKSLLTFVAMETGTLSYELLLRYLTLCVSGGHDNEVFDVYNIMLGSFPSLETGASSLFIKSFGRTARWREAVNILHRLKKIFTPSQRNYSDVISAAMLHGDTTTAWALYDELIEKGLSPIQETWDALFKGHSSTYEEEGKEAQTMSQSEIQERLLGILLFMRINQIYPQHSLASSIKTWFESLTGENWTGSWTDTTPKGVCRCCGSALESIQLTQEEYHQLKHRVMSDIIEGKDVFNKTTPEELEKFKAFVKKKPTFDVVVDGLNVANFSKDKSKMSEMLLAVVSELEHQGLSVLVLGRKHMLRPSRSWERHNMDLIRQKAHCFFTDNISEDDPFLLYATLHSGDHCKFVSRDLMRDHKACLPDGAARQLFFKWQRGHQLVVDGFVALGRRVRFQSIPSYDTIVQSTADSWHLPYDDTDDRCTYEVPQRWLCLFKKH
ncbi:mitochondrial ribonuclease P catalytic subunit [Labrus bergylta]|uniref:Mitochondrial ribonuclease P catalytic subunit n=1 Tax=Labrus bergylta TaxID=56723 RepID=A0A3Q3G7R3_9LABR|nr:mitochondrial ribonuclease P catalytic subunit isoform X1 [Labrus bergylta]XP_029135011.1 mitochondrial ribonuclease P catalytic subunit isoform X1 [Labrus bergylta]